MVHRRDEENTPTRAAIWRSNIILLQIFILLGAVLLQSAQQYTPSRSISVIVDDAYQVRVSDGEDYLVRGDLNACVEGALSVVRTGDAPEIVPHPVAPNTGALRAFSFNTDQQFNLKDYADRIVVDWGGGDKIEVRMTCPDHSAPSTSTTMVLYVLDNVAYVGSFYTQLTPPVRLFELPEKCDLVWEDASGSRRIPQQDMVLVTGGTTLPEGARIAHVFELSDDVMQRRAPLGIDYDCTSPQIDTDTMTLYVSYNRVYVQNGTTMSRLPVQIDRWTQISGQGFTHSEGFRSPTGGMLPTGEYQVFTYELDDSLTMESFPYGVKLSFGDGAYLALIGTD